jgi:hypothetical protein
MEQQVIKVPPCKNHLKKYQDDLCFLLDLGLQTLAT